MMDLFKLFLHVLASLFKSRAKLEAENLILCQQVNLLRRQAYACGPSSCRRACPAIFLSE
jgi:hypothetical protein